VPRGPDAQRPAHAPQHGWSWKRGRDQHSSLRDRTRAGWGGGSGCLLPRGILTQQLLQKALAGVGSDLVPEKGSQRRCGVQMGLDL